MRERPHVRSALAGADRDRIIYDLTGIDRQYDVLRRELPGVEVRFAMKACPVDEVLASLADRGAGFDAASPGEIRQALRTGVAPRRIHYGNTIKSDAEIADAYALGVTTFATDSVEDVRAIARHAPGARVFCRLSTSGDGALWGLTAKCGTEDPVPVLEEARRQGLVPAGLSVHVGSQQMTVRAWERALGDLAAVLPRLKDLEFVNLGGGLPAEGYLDRAGAPMTPPTAEMFAAIRAGLRRLREVAGGDLDFLVEPGRYLVADHGSIRAHVVRLTVRRQPWLYLSCGRFNGLYEADQVGYRLEFPTRSGGRTVPAVVAGPTCDSDDNLGTAPTPVPADLASGDPVWIHGAGAYAISYMTRGFNGYDPLPCISVRAEHVRPITPATGARSPSWRPARTRRRGSPRTAPCSSPGPAAHPRRPSCSTPAGGSGATCWRCRTRPGGSPSRTGPSTPSTDRPICTFMTSLSTTASAAVGGPSACCGTSQTRHDLRSTSRSR
ncbi:hypothetical protein Asp14428_42770 [Actinoplanes sp. NBRC 14428]|nr:hypothetical protein Asp14428_42770 [Actinoplanes sp. NBRC 14428]